MAVAIALTWPCTLKQRRNWPISVVHDHGHIGLDQHELVGLMGQKQPITNRLSSHTSLSARRQIEKTTEPQGKAEALEDCRVSEGRSSTQYQRE